MGLFLGHYTTLKAKLQKNVFNLRAKGPLSPITEVGSSLLLKQEAQELNS